MRFCYESCRIEIDLIQWAQTLCAYDKGTDSISHHYESRLRQHMVSPSLFSSIEVRCILGVEVQWNWIVRKSTPENLQTHLKSIACKFQSSRSFPFSERALNYDLFLGKVKMWLGSKRVWLGKMTKLLDEKNDVFNFGTREKWINPLIHSS